MRFLVLFFAVILALALRSVAAAAGLYLVCDGLNSAGITHINPSVGSLLLIGWGISILVGVNDIKVDAT